MTIDDKFIKRRIRFCEDFIFFNDIKFSLKILIYKFDKLSPTFNNKNFTVKIYGNQKVTVSRKKSFLKEGRDLKKLKGLIKKEKIKQQVFYYGKKSIAQNTVEERKKIYSEIMQFCIYLRELKTLLEIREEEKKLKKSSIEIQNLINQGF